VHLVGLSIEHIHYQDLRNHEHQIPKNTPLFLVYDIEFPQFIDLIYHLVLIDYIQSYFKLDKTQEIRTVA
jgi:hypothetical protein